MNIAAAPHAPQTLPSALQSIQSLQDQLAKRGSIHRSPPPIPTSCCGRGCNGCVWEAYFGAVEYWIWQATALLEEG